MAYSVVERPATGPLSVGGGYKVSREFNIRATSKVHALSLLVNSGVTIGSVYVDALGNTPNIYVRCDDIQIDPLGQEVLGIEGEFIATCKYSSILKSETQTSTGSTDIELVPDGTAIWSQEVSMTDAPVDIDVDGYPIINTAAIAFEPPLTKPEPTEVMVAEWIDSNTNFFDAVRDCRQYNGKVNGSEWKRCESRSALCLGIVPKGLEIQSFTSRGLVRFVGRWQYKPPMDVQGLVGHIHRGNIAGPDRSIGGFTRLLVNKGKMQRNRDYSADKDMPYQVPIMTVEEGKEPSMVSEDVLLNYDGFVGKKGNDVPVFLKWDVIPEANFNNLRI